MLTNKLRVLITFFLLLGYTNLTQAQVALDPTGKRFMKPRERTKLGGPSHLTHAIPAGKDSINITFIEIQLDPSDKGGFDVTARGTKTPKIRGCDNCTVAGRIITNGPAGKDLKTVHSDSLTLAKQEKNGGACRVVTFRREDNLEFTAFSNYDGSFMISTLPNGNYSIWVGGKKVITDFILKTIQPSEEDLKKERELLESRKAKQEEREKQMQQSSPDPGSERN